MKIIFIRHGKTNLKTGKLAFEGVLQIKGVARYLKNEKIDAFFCSPQTRALQTANIINKKNEKPLYIIKEFDERKVLEFGQEEYQKEYEENYLNYDFKTKKFETCKQFIDRIFKGINIAIKKEKTAKTIAIIANTSVLYAINAYVNGIPEDHKIKWFHCSNGAVIKFYI